MTNCWICRSEGNSSEHKIKKSDLLRLYGKGPYKNDNALLHFRQGKQSIIQGPNSKIVKFDRTLCHKCNTTLTQPFDQSYDEFITYFDNNSTEILHVRIIDFDQVYGPKFETKQRELFKYFVKCLGCRIADAEMLVPPDIVDLLPKESFLTGLKVSFHVNEDMALLPSKDQGIGIEDLYYIPNDSPELTGYYCGHHYRWLNMNYWYLWYPDGQLGAPWVADSRYIYLGSHSPLNNTMREELKRKIAARNK